MSRPLRFERHLPHPIERVWRAVTDPAELERWFVASVPWTPAAGEVFEAGGQSGRITELDPPHVIAWSWSVERYRFELRPDGDGCLLIFTHVFDERLGPAEQHAAGWEAYLGRLDVHLAGGFLSEEAAHGQGAHLTVDDLPAVRFERRLAHPVDRVWRAVTEPGELASWFPCQVRVDLRAGGAMAFDFGPELQLEGRVTELAPPRLFAFLWGKDRIRIELEPLSADATLLTFTHVIAEGRDAVARNAAGWHVCLDALARHLADPSAPPVETGPTPEWREHYDAYVERGLPFGAEIPGAA